MKSTAVMREDWSAERATELVQDTDATQSNKCAMLPINKDYQHTDDCTHRYGTTKTTYTHD